MVDFANFAVPRVRETDGLIEKDLCTGSGGFAGRRALCVAAGLARATSDDRGGDRAGDDDSSRTDILPGRLANSAGPLPGVPPRGGYRAHATRNLRAG